MLLKSCDAGGERADGREPLRLAQLVFELPALRDVLRRADDPQHTPGGTSDRERPVADPAHAAIGSHDAVGLVVAVVDLLGLRGAHDPGAVVWVDRVQPAARVAVERRAGAPPDRLVAGADVEDLALEGVGDPEHLPDMIGQIAKSFLARSQPGVREDPRRDVLEGAKDPDGLTVLHLREALGLHPEMTSSGRDQRELEIVRCARVDRGLDGGGDDRPRVGGEQVDALLERRLDRWFEIGDPKGLAGPGQLHR